MVAVQEEMRAQVLQTNGEATLHRSAGTSDKITKLLILMEGGLTLTVRRRREPAKGYKGKRRSAQQCTGIIT